MRTLFVELAAGLAPIAPTLVSGLAAGLALTGCATQSPATPPAAFARTMLAPTTNQVAAAPTTTVSAADLAAQQSDHADPAAAKSTETKLGASAASEAVMADGSAIDLGIWIDAQEARSTTRAPLDIALVIDVSGSMAGSKITQAKEAAQAIVNRLQPDDIVSITTFSDRAQVVLPATRAREGRSTAIAAIDRIVASGETNLFDGLQLGEKLVGEAQDPRLVRRVILISDGKANVGPSDRFSLEKLADRSFGAHAQITALGMGLGYDETTLDALAVRSGGRLYHLTTPDETTPALEKELALLESTVAIDAFLEVRPAPGVALVAAEGWERRRDVLTIPIGALFAGQHRDTLVKLQLVRGASGFTTWDGTPHALASVKLRYRDPADGGLDRVQDVVPHVHLTSNPDDVIGSANSRVQMIGATVLAANATMLAASAIGGGNFDDADATLAQTSANLVRRAAETKAPEAKAQLQAAAAKVDAERTSVATARHSAPAAARESALKMNSAGMSSLGY